MRYQMGSVEPVTTKQGPCWYIRFVTKDGKRPRFRIGLQKQFPSKAAASRAAHHIREAFNNTPASLERPKTFGDVIARYESEEMPKRHSTSRKYLQMHRLYIEPRWGNVPLVEVKAMTVRKWLLDLKLVTSGDPATRSVGHIHGQMRNLFKYTMLWEWFPTEVNPMSLFSIPGATKRTRKPRVITPAHFVALMNDSVLPKPPKRFGRIQGRLCLNQPQGQAMLAGGFLLGLGASELFGLQWHDFDWLASKVWIRRSVVEGHVDATKNEHREAPLPLHAKVASIFLAWLQVAEFREPTDWVFASPALAGERPRHSQHLQHTVLVPAGERVGLDFSLGWHTLRHSYKVLLERAGADITVQRDLMRHSDVHTTTQVYGEVEMDRMRAANDKAVALALENWR